MLKYIIYIFFALMYQSMYMRSNIFLIEIGIKISFSDILALIGLNIIILLSLIKQFSLKIIYHIQYIFLFLMILVLYEFISVIFIDKGNPDNITLGIAILRNLSILLIVMILMQYVNFRKIIKIFTVIGLLNSIIAIYYYIISLNDIAYILSTKHLWDPGIYYTLDSGVLRLQGLSDDPNFFFITNFIALLSSIALILSKNSGNKLKNLFWIISFIIILCSSILTFSRTGFLMIGIFFIAFLINYPKYVKYIFVFIAISLFPTYKIFESRFENALETGGSGRMDLWKVAIEGFSESPFFGEGGRYVLKHAGNYAHNDLLELLSSHGLIYVTIVLFLYIIIILKLHRHKGQLKKLSKHNDFLYFQLFKLGFITLLLSHLFFSIFYNIFIWFILGIAIGIAYNLLFNTPKYSNYIK